MDVIEEVGDTMRGVVSSDGAATRGAEVTAVEKFVYRGVVMAVLAAAVVLAVRSVPDIKRYLRIKQL